MIGILALQGGFAEHAAVLDELALKWKYVRSMDDVQGLKGLILPGGESTVMQKFLEGFGMLDWLKNFEGPILGTCAGMILLCRLGMLNAEVQRNAYGRQLASFVADLQVSGEGFDDFEMRAHFIRAPKLVSVGECVDELSKYDNVPVLVRQGQLWATSGHPELAQETALHKLIFSNVSI